VQSSYRHTIHKHDLPGKCQVMPNHKSTLPLEKTSDNESRAQGTATRGEGIRSLPVTRLCSYTRKGTRTQKHMIQDCPQRMLLLRLRFLLQLQRSASHCCVRKPQALASSAVILQLLCVSTSAGSSVYVWAKYAAHNSVCLCT
jgi:hypothetical protein